MNGDRGLWWSLLGLVVTGVAAVPAGILAASGDGWWTIPGLFIALPGAAIGYLVYNRGVGDRVAAGPTGLFLFAFCTVFALGPAYLTVAGVPRVGVVAEISYAQSDNGATYAMGVAAVLGLLVTLVAGARRPGGFPVVPTGEEHTHGP